MIDAQTQTHATPTTRRTVRHRRRVRARLTVLGVAAGLTLMGGGVTGALLVTAGGQPAVGAMTGKDMAGNTVTQDPGDTLPAAWKVDAVEPAGESLDIPTVGLHVPLGIMSMVDGQITPPTFTAAYQVRNLGVPTTRADNGTVFVAMHALRGGGRGPGNYLQDEAAGKAAVKPGERVTAAGVSYTVTGSQTISKNQISGDPAVWANSPGRLVLITCLEHPDGSPSTKNLIITAERGTK